MFPVICAKEPAVPPTACFANDARLVRSRPQRPQAARPMIERSIAPGSARAPRPRGLVVYFLLILTGCPARVDSRQFPTRSSRRPSCSAGRLWILKRRILAAFDLKGRQRHLDPLDRREDVQ